MFRQTGVISVGTLEQLFDVGRIVADQPVPAGRGVVVVGNSDGAVTLAAAACVDAGLDLAPVELFTAGGRVLSNPIDLSWTADADAFRDALRSVAADEQVHSVLVVYTPPQLSWDQDVVDVVLDVAAASPQVTFATTMLGAAGRARLSRTGADGTVTAVPIFRFPEDAAAALGRLAGYADWRRSTATSAAAGAASGDTEEAQAVLGGALDRLRSLTGAARTVALDHHEQRRLLQAYGVDVIEREVVVDVDEAVAAADRLGWPVALKSSTRDRLTRSVASGVVLDLGAEDQLRAAWQRMEEAVGDGMLPAVVQRFADSGLDVAIEVRRDEDGSGTVRVGLGGPAAIIDEFELGVLPLTLADASSLVAISPVGRVLTDPLDRVPLVEVVHRLAALVEHHDCVRTVAADPVVVSPMSARVADVDVSVGEPIEEFAVRRLD
jgi:acyl-CoA synthetase (NDP forming)